MKSLLYLVSSIERLKTKDNIVPNGSYVTTDFVEAKFACVFSMKYLAQNS